MFSIKGLSPGSCSVTKSHLCNKEHIERASINKYHKQALWMLLNVKGDFTLWRLCSDTHQILGLQ